MAKVDIDYREHLKVTFERMSHDGVLLVSNDPNGRPNVMTIGWGTVGVVWGLPMFLVLVRPQRFSYQCIEHTGDFTVNVQPAERKDLVDFCGTTSGREHDKFAELGLTAIPGEHVSSPIIGECIIHYECKVVHKNDVILEEVEPSIAKEYYPGGDYHRVYYGRILRTCADESLA